MLDFVWWWLVLGIQEGLFYMVVLMLIIIYQVWVVDVNGCVDQVVVIVKVFKEIFVYVLMVFLFNGDNINDCFLFYSWDGFGMFEVFWIFD